MGKTLLSWIQCKWTRKASKSGNFFSLETASNIQEKAFTIPKTISDCKNRKLWNILSLQASNLAPKSGTSLAVRRVSPGKIIVLLFWTKYVVPHQIKLRILKLTIRRAQSTICIVFICVCWAENGYYRVVMVGQLSFDCRMYCGLSCRMQGEEREKERIRVFVLFPSTMLKHLEAQSSNRKNYHYP